MVSKHEDLTQAEEVNDSGQKLSRGAGGQGFDSYGLNNSTGLKTTKTLKTDLPLPCERLLELRVAQI